jgi:mycoredoxin
VSGAASPAGLGTGAAVTVMWRPGCPYCAMLLRGLERTGLVFDRVDIWEHPEAAAWVRTVADGNETVPTVRIAAPGAESGTDALALVNPSPRAVLDAVARLVPDALPAESDADPGAHGHGPLARLSGRLRQLRGRQGPGRGPAGPR